MSQQGKQGLLATTEALLESAEQGDALAQFQLGMTYLQGRGVKQNYAEASKWLRKAAEQGDAGAQHNLGIMYERGVGVTQDFKEAAKWYRMAAEQGVADAQFNYGGMYLQGKGVPQDYAEAAIWIRKAAEQGKSTAQFNLGVMYAKGNGVPQDYTEAVKWYWKAAEQDYYLAQTNLGAMYYRGNGVPQDYNEAAKWYRKAAELGDGIAQLNLGYMYAQGKGVHLDLIQSYFWFKKAASSLKGEKQEEASKSLNKVAENMTPQQIAEAQRFISTDSVPSSTGTQSSTAMKSNTQEQGSGQTIAEKFHKNGYEYGSLGKFDEAKEEFEKALKILSNNDNLKRHLRIIEDVNQQKIEANLAISYFKAIAFTSGKQWDQAIEESNKSLEINPEFVDAYINRGNIYFIKGQYDKAILDFNEAIILHPEDPFLYVLRGYAYDKKSLTNNALSDYKKAIKVDPNYSLAYAKRGYILYVRKGEYDRAISDYNKAIELYSEDPVFYTLRGNVYRTKGQMEKATSDFNKAKELNSKRSGISNNQAKTNDRKSQNKAIPITSYEILPQPILSTLEELKNVSHFTVARGYLALERTMGLLEIVVKRSNMKLIFLLNGEQVTVTQETAPQMLQDFQEKLQVYKHTIEQRGYPKVDGFYNLDVNKAIQGKDYLSVVTLFADKELSPNEYILAGELQIKQQDFNVQIIREVEIGGEKKNLDFSGLVIEDSIIFKVPNIKFCFYGTLNNDKIELKIDLNELNRSQSMELALQAFTDPEKASASDLNRVSYSDWLVRLDRKSSNQPMEPISSDQLLIITPDKKLRHATREEIDSNSLQE